MPIGEKIRKIRELRGFSQEFMASELEISQPGYSKIEKDEVKPDIDRLGKIANVLGIDLQSLLNFDDSFVFNIQNNVYETGSNAVSGVVNYFEANAKQQYEQLLKEKDEHITALKKQIETLEQIISDSRIKSKP